jgi:hypothetical protein
MEGFSSCCKQCFHDDEYFLVKVIAPTGIEAKSSSRQGFHHIRKLLVSSWTGFIYMIDGEKMLDDTLISWVYTAKVTGNMENEGII